MIRATRQAEAGYTIVETMIFLIITGALMASAALLFNGKINRAQFTQAAQAFNSQVNTAINDVATGTFPSSGGFSCQPGTNGAPTITQATDTGQGTNSSCIFVGKVLQPGVKGSGCDESDTSQCTKYNIYSVMGNRLFSGQEVDTLAKSFPAVIDNPVDLTEYKNLPNGITVTGAYIKDTKTKIGAVGFFQTFGHYDANGLVSSAQNVQVVAVGKSFPLDQTGDSSSLEQAVKDLSKSDQIDASPGIVICLSGGNNQDASITIGLNNSNITTDLVIGQDSTCR